MDDEVLLKKIKCAPSATFKLDELSVIFFEIQAIVPRMISRYHLFRNIHGYFFGYVI